MKIHMLRVCWHKNLSATGRSPTLHAPLSTGAACMVGCAVLCNLQTVLHAIHRTSNPCAVTAASSDPHLAPAAMRMRGHVNIKGPRPLAGRCYLGIAGDEAPWAEGVRAAQASLEYVQHTLHRARWRGRRPQLQAPRKPSCLPVDCWGSCLLCWELGYVAGWLSMVLLWLLLRVCHQLLRLGCCRCCLAWCSLLWLLLLLLCLFALHLFEWS